MIEKDKLYSIWVYLQAEPLFWLTLTIGSYLIGDYFYKKSKLFPLVNPVAISIFIVSLVLINLDISYERYFDGAKFIHFMLGPATVALADISFSFKKSKAKVPKEAPIIPVKIVIMAVSDGIPPIKSAIPIAIGAVALRGSILNKT